MLRTFERERERERDVACELANCHLASRIKSSSSSAIKGEQTVFLILQKCVLGVLSPRVIPHSVSLRLAET